MYPYSFNPFEVDFGHGFTPEQVKERQLLMCVRQSIVSMEKRINDYHKNPSSFDHFDPGKNF